MVQPGEEGPVLQDLLHEGIDLCSKGRSTRMPMDWLRSGAPAAAARSFAACMRPGPPPVTISHPISARARATRLTSS